MTTAFITHDDCLLHDMGTHHPEQPARLRAVEDQLIASGLIGFLPHVEAPLATREHLERVHQRGLSGRHRGSRAEPRGLCTSIPIPR